VREDCCYRVDDCLIMPKVGGKHYSYTPAGMAAAKKAAAKQGVKVSYSGSKKNRGK
jgi:hypothetical protein